LAKQSFLRFEFDNPSAKPGVGEKLGGVERNNVIVHRNLTSWLSFRSVRKALALEELRLDLRNRA
jgi:hypothetical protein